VSHLRERQEKNCLNCNARVYGTYCHICGQENIEPTESVWHLGSHYFYDITHFDGKFFSTLKYLIWRPGFLPAEYARGRRASYLNPIRMYVFTSAFFFLIFFSFINPQKDEIEEKGDTNAAQVLTKLEKQKNNLVKELKKETDSSEIVDLKTLLSSTNANIDSIKIDSSAISRLNINSDDFVAGSSRLDRKTDKKRYDSLQATLVPEKRDGYILRMIKYKKFDLNARYKSDKAIFNALKEDFIHRFPQFLFISLPFFALILKLLYARKKNFNYANHVIFTLHLYIFIFIALLGVFSLSRLGDLTHYGIFKTLGSIIVALIFFYLYKAMRNFYQQRRAKTIVKFLALNFLFMIVQLFLFVFFVLYTMFML
jgi:hypothetical protein